MEPSVEFLKRIAGKPHLLKLIERYKKEFDIYQYLSDHIPKKFGDKEWEKLLQTKSIDERVSFWNFVSMTQKREEADFERKEARRKKIVEFYTEQERLYNSGAMGYGPGLYRLWLDPFAQLKKEVEDAYDVKQYISNKLNEHPTIALDFQHLETEGYAQRGRLNNNARYVLTENRIALDNPFPLTIINVDQTKPVVKTFIDGLGLFSRETTSSYFLPKLNKGNPFLNAKGEPNADVVYISRYARDMLDGPLRNDAYIIPVSFDSKRESISAARKNNIRAMALPIRKYVKWQSGPMVLPMTNILKILNMVSRTGGDWHRALHENISQRHLISHDEHRVNQAPHKEVAKFRREDKVQVTAAIKEAFGER